MNLIKFPLKQEEEMNFNGDIVGIDFDSYHDHRTGFEFNVTAAGTKNRSSFNEPMELAMYNWNAVWYVEIGMEDSAWTAEYRDSFKPAQV